MPLGWSQGRCVGSCLRPGRCSRALSPITFRRNMRPTPVRVGVGQHVDWHKLASCLFVARCCTELQLVKTIYLSWHLAWCSAPSLPGPHIGGKALHAEKQPFDGCTVSEAIRGYRRLPIKLSVHQATTLVLGVLERHDIKLHALAQTGAPAASPLILDLQQASGAYDPADITFPCHMSSVHLQW